MTVKGDVRALFMKLFLGFKIICRSWSCEWNVIYSMKERNKSVVNMSWDNLTIQVYNWIQKIRSEKWKFKLI